MTDSTHCIDIRALPGTTEAIAYQDGGLFPIIDVGADGSLSAVVRGGAGHLGLSGRLDLLRSQDGGRSWAPPAVIVDSAIDDRNAAFGVSNKGTLVMVYYRQAGYDADGKYAPSPGSTSVAVTRSFDHGLNWETPVEVDTHGLPGSPFGRIITLANGALLMPIYTAADVEGFIAGSYFMRSHDDGATWSTPELICPGRDETTVILLPDGGLVAALRKTERAEQSLAICRSSDQGITWSAPEEVTGRLQHPADLVLLPGDRLLLTYSNRTQPYRMEGRISDDGGRSWRPELLLFSGQLYGYDLPESRGYDFGYPSTAIIEGGTRGVTIYYVNPFSQSTDRTFTGPKTTGFYLANGYRAVVISWSVEELLKAIGE